MDKSASGKNDSEIKQCDRQQEMGFNRGNCSFSWLFWIYYVEGLKLTVSC